MKHRFFLFIMHNSILHLQHKADDFIQSDLHDCYSIQSELLRVKFLAQGPKCGNLATSEHLLQMLINRIITALYCVCQILQREQDQHQNFRLRSKALNFQFSTSGPTDRWIPRVSHVRKAAGVGGLSFFLRQCYELGFRWLKQCDITQVLLSSSNC